MSAQATARAPAHREAPAHRGRSALTVPLVAGLSFGAYAGFLDRDNGAATHSSIILGVVGAAVVMVLGLVLGRVQARLTREMVSAAYGGLFGSAAGYLVSLSGTNTWLKATFMGFFWSVGMAIVAYYVLLYRRGD